MTSHSNSPTISFHTCIPCVILGVCLICIVSKHGFRGVRCGINCYLVSVMWSILCGKHVCILCLLHIGYTHTVFILGSQLLIIEHVVSMATTSKAIIKHKLPSVQEELETSRLYYKIFLAKKYFKNFAFLGQLKVQDIEFQTKWTAEREKF
jgi:ABC-type tungstate transport system substrate-binding protein